MIIPSLEALPVANEKRLAVRVTRDAERQLRGGHPWLFDRSIESVSHQGAPGDLAVVFDHDRRFLAIGLWDPASPIRVRVLHSGRPTTIDEPWWNDRLTVAAARRGPLLASGSTTGYRLVHGENDGLGGFVADVYDTTIVVKLYSAAWLPHLQILLPLLVQVTGADRVVLRLGRLVQGQVTFGLEDGDTLVGEPPDGPVRFLEHGLTFEADVIRGQKTGHFLDQRYNRARLGTLAARARVLDVFAYTGGFSVHAAAGGAREVVSTDLSAHALAAAEVNMALNRSLATVAACRHRTIVGDGFEVMGDLASKRERFDVVVIDPPSFASRQGDAERAMSAYRRLTFLALDLIGPGGLLVQASCSSRVPSDEFVAGVYDAAATAGRPLTPVATTDHDIDHPIGFPEGAYLKAVFATVS